VGALAVLITFVCADGSLAQTTRNRRGAVVVGGLSGQSETVNARGRDVRVTGNDNRIQVRGTARVLRIEGSNNHVRIYTVRTIEVAGTGNRVTYYKGPGTTTPKVYTNQGGNLIQKAR
jgi:hypothetical protein